MAVIGRRACPWCGFASAHVRQNEGKRPYMHCPECGMGTQAKNGVQAELLLKGMKPEPRPGHHDLLPAPGAGAIVVKPEPKHELEPKPQAKKPDPAPAPPVRKRQSWFSTILDRDDL